MAMSALGRTGESFGIAREDLVGAVVLLQPLVDVPEGDQGERMIGIEIEAEAQIDDRRQLVALGVADDAEAVEHFGGAVLGVADERHAAACRP